MIASANLFLVNRNINNCIHNISHYAEAGKCVRPQKNKSAIIIKIDGCVINNGKKCDCLILVEQSLSKRYAFFVELKGGANHTSYKNAIEQIEASKDNQLCVDLLNATAIPSGNRRAVIIIGPKAKTNRPAKEEVEEQLGVRLKIVSQLEGECEVLSP